MNRFISDLRQAFTSRICWTVAAATFSAIIFVEILILIPSVNSFSEQWREQRSNEVRIALENRLLSDMSPIDGNQKLEYHLNQLLTTQTITSWQVMYPAHHSSGGDFANTVNRVTLPQQALWDSSAITLGLDAEQLHQEQRDYVLRIASLVAIIAVFTTVATLIVLFYTILRPVIELHAQIKQAKDNGLDYSYRVANWPQKNELGLVINEFNSMLEHIQKSFKRAQLDGLTKLPNRNIGLAYLQQSLDQATRFKRPLAVMFIDLDNFKTVNDQLGHDAGDELLVNASSRIASRVKVNDKKINTSMVSRIGGDEFMVVLNEIICEQEPGNVARQIISAFEEPFILSRERVQHVGISIGIAVYPNNGIDSNELLISADTALYESKARGRGQFQFFSDKMSKNLVRRMKIEVGLRQAIERNDFAVFYQPVVDVETQQTVGVEALIRWQHAELGWVSPEEFIAIAESIGLINTIGYWVTNQACSDIAALHQQGYCLRLAVNVSSKQFRHGNFVSTIREIVKTNNFPINCLELEITEGLFIDNQTQTQEIIKALSAEGAQFSLDDFGTGYSSLSYLRQFKVHRLKIDKTFIANVESEQQDAILAKTIIAMAHTLDMRVVAEGVETQSHHEFLRQHGCEYAQGYWYGKPMSLPSLVAFLKEQNLKTPC